MKSWNIAVKDTEEEISPTTNKNNADTKTNTTTEFN